MIDKFSIRSRQILPITSKVLPATSHFVDLDMSLNKACLPLLHLPWLLT